jgi:hypothetical protein
MMFGYTRIPVRACREPVTSSCPTRSRYQQATYEGRAPYAVGAWLRCVENIAWALVPCGRLALLSGSHLTSQWPSCRGVAFNSQSISTSSLEAPALSTDEFAVGPAEKVKARRSCESSDRWWLSVSCAAPTPTNPKRLANMRPSDEVAPDPCQQLLAEIEQARTAAGVFDTGRHEAGLFVGIAVIAACMSMQ